MPRVVCVLTLSLVVLALGAGDARADAVGVRASQLRDGDYKVRLSAALWLSKSDDPRAVAALANALRKESRSTIREIAVRSLARRADDPLPGDVRRRVLDALERAGRRDRRSKIRALARRTHARWKSAGSDDDDGGTRRGRLSKVFVAIDSASSRSRRVSSRDLQAIDGAVRTSIRRGAPRYKHRTRREGLPTSAQLARARAAGFYVKATVTEVRARRVGGGVEVSCAVEVQVSSWEGSDRSLRMRAGDFASASARGKVVGGASRAGMAASTRDCVVAVAESATQRQVLPFLARRARQALSAHNDTAHTSANRSARASHRRSRRRRP